MTLPARVVDDTLPTPSRRRLIVFWIVAVIFLALLLMDILQTRPWYLLVPLTVWGGWGEVGNHPSHNIHMLIVALIHWGIIGAVAVQASRPQQRIGAAWTYLILGGVTLVIALVVADLPPEVVPILIGVLVFAVIAFAVHPSPWKAKFQRVGRPSTVLAILVVVAAIPLIVFAADSFAINAASGPGDEHYEFGHWTFMGIYPIVTLLMAVVSTLKVSGWRLPGLFAGVLVIAHGLGSLVVSGASSLSTLWAVLALLWGVAFVVAVEREARAAVDTSAPAPTAA